MHAAMMALLAVAVTVATAAAAVSEFPSTPAIDTENENMKIRVGESNTISFQFGPNAEDKIDVKDPHEPTISALALGYSIGAQLDNLKCNDKLEDKLQDKLDKVEDEVSKRVDQLDIVTDRLDKLSGANSKALAGMQAIVDQAVIDLKAVVNENGGGGGGGAQEAVGAAHWNSISTVRIEDSDPTQVFITWPVTSPSSDPLIVHDDAEFYTVVFTALKDGQETTDTRTIGPVRAMTPRLLSVVVPAWFGQQDSLPVSSHFEASVKVYEQGRPMANPKNNVVKISATAPKTDAPKEWKISGVPSKAKTFTLGLTLSYPYTDKWADVVVAAAGTHSRVGSISVVGTGQKRTLSLVVDSSEDFDFELRITSQSKASGQKTVHIMNVHWSKAVLETFDPILSDTQTQQLLQRVGGEDKEWKMCFHARQSGGGSDDWSTSTMHSKCTRTGRKLLYIARRGDNMRVYGGYLYNGASRNAGYYQNGESRNFMFRAVNKNSNVEYATNIGRHGRHGHYIADSYAYTTGGGHDMYCNSNFQGCYSNFDHGWWTSALGSHCYGGTNCRNWLTGGYSWTLKGASNSVYAVFYATN